VRTTHRSTSRAAKPIRTYRAESGSLKGSWMRYGKMAAKIIAVFGGAIVLLLVLRPG
jgi:hypothetical protein